MEYIAGLSIFTLILILVSYFLPSLIALMRGKSNTFAILILNIFLGWTFIGWIVALIWSVTSDNKAQTVVINNSTNFDNQTRHQQIGNAKHSPPSVVDPKSTLIKSHRENIKNLKEIKQLLDNGVLTQDEFNFQKSQILTS